MRCITPSCFLAAATILFLQGSSAANSTDPTVSDDKQDVTYVGQRRNGIEVFLGIPFGEDTGGPNRFKPPVPFIPVRGAIVDAQSYGAACPQKLSGIEPPFYYTPVDNISEDCLNLVLGRPKGTTKSSRLPVMVYIYGGSLWSGQNKEAVTAPDGLVIESVENGTPVIVVGVNYRLGAFGFAQSDALQAEGSENAGLRDQRLGIEWVRDHIEQFGGDPDKITIFGQSSGGLSVGMQIMAYGGSKPAPFQQAICESQALEPGITGNFTFNAMELLVDAVGCNTTDLHSKETVACLRALDMETYLNASIATYQDDIAHNLGDIWLPVVDGDFLPAAPSKLIKEGKFSNITTMIGWCDGDMNIFVDTTIETNQDVFDYIQAYVPEMTATNVQKLLSLYPVSEFPANVSANLSSNFYRTARIVRDILMTCQPMFYAENIAARGNSVYLYDWNMTISDQIFAEVYNVTGYGVVHTSDLEYVFGNLSTYDVPGYPYNPSPADYALMTRGSRSWSTYATAGRPSLPGHDTLVGFTDAFPGGDRVDVFIAGGPHEGLSSIDGPGAESVLEAQKLRERCAFINSDEVIEQLRY
ncbi:putative lipase [Xylariaceae sp. FL0255]|nr:putative lipase [Xylariaceae sp. FL0255]